MRRRGRGAAARAPVAVASTFLAVLAAAAPPAVAQETPFSEVRVRGAVGAGGLDRTTGSYWRLEREWSAEVAGRFHGGWLTLLADRSRFLGRASDLPPVAGHLFAVAWKRGVSLPLRLDAEAGGLVGGLWLEDEAGRMAEAEADLTVGAELALTGPPLGPVRPFVRGRWRRAFFHHPLDLRTVSAGLEWRGRLPDRLASALGGEGAGPPREGRRPPGEGDRRPGGRGGAAGSEPTPSSTDPAAAAGDDGTVRTLTRADLDRAGVTRAADLLRLLDGWSGASVDRYVWRLLPRTGSVFHDPHPKVLVDGIPVPVGVLGVAGLEHLPVSIADLDSVRVVEGPLLEGGEPSAGGVLHLHTRRPRAPGVRAAHEEGNPVGDPGLLEHTPLGTPNVERIGRYTTLRLEHGGPRGHAALAHGIAARFHTDHPERDRVERTRAPVDADSWIRTARTGGTAGLSLPGGEVHMLAGATRTRDFFLLPVLGTEVLTRNDGAFVGLAGQHALPGTGGSLGFRATAARRNLVQHAFDPRPGFGFRRRALSGEVRWEGDRAMVGLHHDVREARAEIGPDGERVHRSRLFGRSRLPGDVRLDGSLSRVGAATGAAAALSRSWRPSATSFVTARAAAASEPFAEDDGFAFWHLRGYRIPARPELVLDARARPGPRSWLLADLRGGLRAGGAGHRIDAGVWLRRDRGIAFAAPRFRVEAVVPVGSDTVPYRSGERGALAGIWARGEGPLGDAWRWGAAASRDAVLGGSTGFREARAEVPAGEISGWLLWRGLPDLTVRLSARRRGPSFWSRWSAPDAEDGMRLDGRTTVDVAVQKWAWRGRLRGVLVVRDVLDRDRRLHPIGISPGRRLLARVEARLGG